MSTKKKTRGILSLSEIGRRVRDERIRRGFSLEQLSQRSRVSRSMISAIERGAKAPTVVVLHRIATGLDTSLSRLVEEETSARVIVLRHSRQKVVRAAAGWERRILSPVLPGIEFEFMRITVGPLVNAPMFLPHAHRSREYVAVEKGTLLFTLDGEPHTLKAGDSIYFDGDCITGFETPVAFPACTTWQWTSRVTPPEPTIVRLRQRLSLREKCIRVSAKWVLRAPKCHAVAKCRRRSWMSESVAGGCDIIST